MAKLTDKLKQIAVRNHDKQEKPKKKYSDSTASRMVKHKVNC